MVNLITFLSGVLKGENIKQEVISFKVSWKHLTILASNYARGILLNDDASGQREL